MNQEEWSEWECRRPLNWHATTRLWLSLEPFTNAGLTQAEMTEVVERLGYRVESMGLNHNLIVEVDHCDHEGAKSIVGAIRHFLHQRVLSKKKG